MEERSLLKKYLQTLGIVEVAALAGSQVAKEVVSHSPQALDKLLIGGDYVGSTVGSAIQHLVANHGKYFADGTLDTRLAVEDLARVVAVNIPVCAATYSIVAAANPTETIVEMTGSESLAAVAQWAETALIWHTLNFPVFSLIQQQERFACDPGIQELIEEASVDDFREEYGVVPFQSVLAGRGCWPPEPVAEVLAIRELGEYSPGSVKYISSGIRRELCGGREHEPMVDFALLFDQRGEPLMEMVRLGDRQDTIGYRGQVAKIGFFYVGGEPGSLVQGFREISNLYHSEYKNPARRLCKKVPLLRDLAA